MSLLGDSVNSGSALESACEARSGYGPPDRVSGSQTLQAAVFSLCCRQTVEMLEESNSCGGFFADPVLGDGEPFSALALEEPAPL